MLMFVDTEYTAFTGPRLISLALVAEDGDSELYGPWHHALHDARALRLGWLAWRDQDP